MNLKQLIHEDDAVSPVIGVILMVAITVILAAVIATFVLGLGDNLSNTAPQATFGFDYDGSDLTITHEGGDNIKAGQLYVRGDVSYPWTNDYSSSAMISAGSSVTVTSGDGITDSSSISVVWDTGNGNSATLAKWEGPDA